MLKNNARWRNFFIPLAGCVLMFAGGNVFAEWWGYNAPPCSNGHCARSHRGDTRRRIGTVGRRQFIPT